MRHVVKILPLARCDLRSIDSYISRKVSRASADKWSRGIFARIRTLEETPGMWPIADEAAISGLELRMLLFGRKPQVYRILFEIQGNVVGVHRVRHAAQDSLTADDFLQ